MIYMHFYYASYFGIVKKSNASWSHLTKLRCRKKSMTNDVPTIIMSQLPSSTVWEHVFTSLIVRWILIAFDTKSPFSMISTNRISTILEKPDRGNICGYARRNNKCCGCRNALKTIYFVREELFCCMSVCMCVCRRSCYTAWMFFCLSIRHKSIISIGLDVWLQTIDSFYEFHRKWG